MLAATEEIGPLRASGFVAWLLWLAVHPLFLTGFTKGRWRLSYRGYPGQLRIDAGEFVGSPLI